MISLALRTLAIATVALATTVFIVACGTGGSGNGSGGGDAGDVVGIGNIGGKVNAVSGDGMVVVGQANVVDSSSEAFRWTSAGGLVGLGDLPGGDFFSIARAVSRDGSVVVGGSHSDLSTEAFRWTAADGMVGLGSISGTSPLTDFSEANAVSTDGSQVVGRTNNLESNGNDSFHWTVGTGIESDGDLPFGTIDGNATAIFDYSDAGGSITLVAGIGVSNTVTKVGPDPSYFPWHKEAYILSSLGFNPPLVPLGDISGGFVLPGEFGPCPNPNGCFRAAIMSNDNRSPCTECTSDGEVAHKLDSSASDVFVRFASISIFRTIVVVGASLRDDLPESFPEAFRWQEDRPFFGFDCHPDRKSLEDANPNDPPLPLCMQGLGDLPGGIAHSGANAISGAPSNNGGDGGAVIVGYGYTANGKRAFRWENTGSCDPYPDPISPGPLDPCMVELGELLEATVEAGSCPASVFEPVDPGDWTFTEATDISDDGNVIVGNGINPDGEEEGWIINLVPCP